MAASGFEPRKVDIGHVLKETFGVIGRRFAVLAGLSFLMVGLPTLAVGFLQLAADPAGGSNANATAVAGFGGLAVALVTLILQGALTHATVMDQSNRKVVLAESLAAGLRAFLPILAIGILYGLAVALGILLLIVPGVMVAVAWCVAVPAYVGERVGITGSFSRAADLTRGNRWRIFGLFLILFILLVVVMIGYVALIGLASFTQTDGPAVTWRSIIADAVFNTVYGLITTTAFAVLYVELRRIRDGVGGESLAAIFD